MTGKLFVISGPSGAGKGTLVKNVVSRRGKTWVSVSATTRLPRKGEVDGQSYFFLSDKEFDDLVASGGFLEWANVHSKRYGTLRQKVEEKIAEGTDVILEIDTQGAMQVKKNYPDAYLIFIEPPSFEVLRQRLEGRGTETAHQIESRLQAAKVEMQQKSCYNVSLVNDNLKKATNELLSIMNNASSGGTGDR